MALPDPPLFPSCLTLGATGFLRTNINDKGLGGSSLSLSGPVALSARRNFHAWGELFCR